MAHSPRRDFDSYRQQKLSDARSPKRENKPRENKSVLAWYADVAKSESPELEVSESDSEPPENSRLDDIISDLVFSPKSRKKKMVEAKRAYEPPHLAPRHSVGRHTPESSPESDQESGQFRVTVGYLKFKTLGSNVASEYWAQNSC